MINLLTVLLLAPVQADDSVKTCLVQVHPAPGKDAAPPLRRSAGQQRAIVLIHGYRVLWRDALVPEASLQSWQQSGSILVRALSKEGDVFSFAYGQNAGVDVVAGSAALRDSIRRVRALGYSEVVLVGHSAGGLVVRQFVEDCPDAGVTRVVQVSAPNLGSDWSKQAVVLPKSQRPFVLSLSEQARRERAGKAKGIPAKVQFVCIVGVGLGSGDGLLSVSCQWPDELQRQGVPAVPLKTVHLMAVRTKVGADVIARAVREKQPRWNETKVREMRDSFARGHKTASSRPMSESGSSSTTKASP